MIHLLLIHCSRFYLGAVRFIIICGVTAFYEPQPSLEVKAAGLDFLTTGFLQGGAVNPTPNPQPGGPGVRICDPPEKDDPDVPPGTGY
jgi:hypothetical protein